MGPHKWIQKSKAGYDHESPYARKPARNTEGEEWDAMFQRLLLYKDRHGDCEVPQKYQADKELSQWVQTQRRGRDHCLSNRQVNLLDSVGFSWTANSERWETMFARLLKYKEENADCLVPQRLTPLGPWVDKQRKDKAKKSLPTEREAQLDSIGFVWRVTRDTWDTMFTRLLKFREKYGHCVVPQKFDEDPKLGNWVKLQRRLNNTNRITDERRAQLNSIGFKWCTLESWEVMFNRLLEHKRMHGNSLDDVDDIDPKLGRWVKAQRSNRYKISEEREARLDAVGFEWSVVPEATWDSMFEALIEYKRTHGDCQVPKRYKGNPQLRRFVQNQRRYKQRLSTSRKDKLESIGFSFKCDEDQEGSEATEPPTGRSASSQPNYSGETRVASAERDYDRAHSSRRFDHRKAPPGDRAMHRTRVEGPYGDGPPPRSRFAHREEAPVPDGVHSAPSVEAEDERSWESLASSRPNYGRHQRGWTDTAHADQSQWNSMPRDDHQRLLSPAGLAASQHRQTMNYPVNATSIGGFSYDARDMTTDEMALRAETQAAQELEAALLRYQQLRAHRYSGLVSNPYQNPSLAAASLAVAAQHSILPYHMQTGAVLPPFMTRGAYLAQGAHATTGRLGLEDIMGLESEEQED